MNKEIRLEDFFPLIDEQLNSGGSAVLTIHGTSMQPFLIDRKDSVRLEKPSSTPKKYDVIFYRRDNGDFILHRIVKVKGGGFVCRGDNQVDDEFPVVAERVIGIVTQYNRGGDWKNMDCFSQRCFAFLWVNTMILRKIKRKIFSLFKVRRLK
ncbi:MAG: hypothetical protein E7586_04350 [Ruminococcaceae bacterium]|nr:hypothetical protein [Oscillospiraceae bacterium]